MFGSWVGDSTWLNYIIIKHINASVIELTGYELDGDYVEDIGYVQVPVQKCTELLLAFWNLREVDAPKELFWRV